ncbi:MAG: N-acetylmuramoyl-L-alanine amidase [Thermoanaerobacterales bacterium 50_218]|nr:MAG: N-acetylmuramoyl-L-alanine amidase [Thermoanaerobacterales bacterium 50_218]
MINWKKPSLIILIKRMTAVGLITFFFPLLVVFLVYTSVPDLRGTNSLKGRKIVIDPGHGGIDGGANSSDFLEKEVNLEVAKKLYQELTRSGAQVILTRKGDVSLDQLNNISSSRHKRDLYARVSLIEKHKPDIFLSLHINANYRQPSTTGSIVFYNKGILNSEKLATVLQENLNILMEKHNLKKHRAEPADYYILRNTNYTGVIVEMGFMSNPREKEMLKTSRYQWQLTKSIVRGIEEYFSTSGNYRPNRTTENFSEGLPGIKVYFPGSKGEDLECEQLQTKKVLLSKNVTKELVFEVVARLIRGPQRRDLWVPFDPETKIRHIVLIDGVVEVDFSPEFTRVPGGSFAELLAIKSLVKTVTQFEGIYGVKILIEGREAELLGHLDLSKVLTPEVPKAVIALVIDDLAGGETGRKEIMTIRRPLTLAVMPGLESSTEIAREAYRRGYEVFLHLPMEPEVGRPEWLGPGAITTATPLEKIREIVLTDLQDVPHAAGINNHMGSKITKREEMMREIFKVASEMNLIFLDSKTTPDSVAARIAKELKVPFVERDVFLDEVNSLEHVKKQIRHLAEIATKTGQAIGIGHVGITGINTSRGIIEMIPWLEDQGIELVFVSDLCC